MAAWQEGDQSLKKMFWKTVSCEVYTILCEQNKSTDLLPKQKSARRDVKKSGRLAYIRIAV